MARKTRQTEEKPILDKMYPTPLLIIGLRQISQDLSELFNLLGQGKIAPDQLDVVLGKQRATKKRPPNKESAKKAGAKKATRGKKGGSHGHAG